MKHTTENASGGEVLPGARLPGRTKTKRSIFAALACASLVFTSCLRSGGGLSYPKADPETEYLGSKWEVVIPQTIQGIPVTVIGGGSTSRLPYRSA
jgi:hypothetical protein